MLSEVHAECEPATAQLLGGNDVSVNDDVSHRLLNDRHSHTSELLSVGEGESKACMMHTRFMLSRLQDFLNDPREARSCCCNCCARDGRMS